MSNQNLQQATEHANAPSELTKQEMERWLDTVSQKVALEQKGNQQQAPSANNFFLPFGYRENHLTSSDTHLDTYWPDSVDRLTNSWQEPVYRFTQTLAHHRKPDTILDIGCGTGYKLAKYLGNAGKKVVGVDQGSGVRIAIKNHPHLTWLKLDLSNNAHWKKLKNLRPDLVICSDVIEHVDNPSQLLNHIRSIMNYQSMFVLSTPDRKMLEQAGKNGPPSNPKHVREWSMDEMELLLKDTGFETIQKHSLYPRKYLFSIREALRIIWRAINLKPIPDKKYNMVFVIVKR